MQLFSTMLKGKILVIYSPQNPFKIMLGDNNLFFKYTAPLKKEIERI